MNWLFTNNDTSSLGQGLIDTSHSIIRSLDFAEEDWLLESGLGGELSSIEDSSSSGDELTTSSVDCVSVKTNIHHVESDSSHVLLSQDTLLGGPLEGSLQGVLDFSKVLDGLGLIDEQVRSSGVGSEAPNLLGIIDVPAVVVS